MIYFHFGLCYTVNIRSYKSKGGLVLLQKALTEAAQIIIPRKRIYSRFDAAFSQNRCVYLSSQIGWGKTTAAALWLTQAKIPNLWFSLKRDTNAIAQIRQADRKLAPNGIIVLDDFQCTDYDARNELCHFIKQSEQRYLILSRSGIPNQLKSEIGRNLQLMGPNQLAFSYDETEEFLRLSQVYEISTGFLNSAAAQNCWPLALRFLSQVLQEQNRYYDQTICTLVREELYTYFDHKFYEYWTKAEQKFLLTIGAFDVLTRKQMEQLTGMENVNELLDGFLLSGSYLKQVAPDTYEMESFFRDYLASRQQKYIDASVIKRIYRNAGHLFESDKQFKLALDCYLRCQDFDSLAYLLEQFSQNGVGQSELWEYRSYFRALPETTVKESPSLCCAMSMLGVIGFRLEEAEEWERQLKALKNSLPKEDERRHDIDDKLAYLAIASPQKHQNNVVSMMHHIAESVSGGTVSMQKISLTANRPSTYNGGRDFSRYCNYFRPLVPVFDKIVLTLYGRDAVGCTDVGIAEWLYQQNRMSEALIQAVQAITKIERNGDIAASFAAHYVQMCIMLAQGQLPTTKTMLQNIKDRIISEKADYLLHNVSALEAWFALYENDSMAVQNWMETDAPDETNGICTLDRFQYSVKLRCYLYQRKYLQLLSLAEQLRPILIAFDRTIEMCELECLLALSEFAQKQTSAAFDHLEKSLALAKRRKLYRTLSDEGMPLCLLMQDYIAAKGKNSFLEEIWQEAKNTGLYYINYLSPPSVLEIPLTETELDVLRLMAAGRSNDEICRTLGIKLNTVKTHAKNLFAKLNAKNRTQAVKAARDAKII